MPPIKLNLGAGATIISGFTPVDRKLGSEVFPLTYADNSVDEIRASHVLEHFSHRLTIAVLRDWIRALKPGGVLKIAVPDFDYATHHGDHPHFEQWIMGSHSDGNDHHGALFWREKLESIFKDLTLEEISTWESEINDCAALPVSLNLSGRKPAESAEQIIAKEFARPPKIACVLSCPRVGWTDFWGEAYVAFSAFGIPIIRFTGAFWDQGIQNALEEAMKRDLDFIFTCDYDSLFTGEDVAALIDHIRGNPNIDALAAYQPRRGTQKPMFQGNPPRDPGPAPFAVASAHFGLTILRASAFAEVKQPWFLHRPDSFGGYRGDDRIDADEWFWHQWRAAGRSVFVDPSVRIGHLEVMVSEFNETLQPRYVSVDAWRWNASQRLAANFAKV